MGSGRLQINKNVLPPGKRVRVYPVSSPTALALSAAVVVLALIAEGWAYYAMSQTSLHSIWAFGLLGDLIWIFLLALYVQPHWLGTVSGNSDIVLDGGSNIRVTRIVSEVGRRGTGARILESLFAIACGCDAPLWSKNMG